MILDDEKDKILDDEIKEDDDSKYYVEEEQLETVFHDAPEPSKEKVNDEEEEVPQNKEGYQVTSQLIEEETERLAPVTVSSEMRKSFLEYAMSVIVSRALPDARDGMKPVHRRILYAMHELGLTAGGKHKKSARIVGDVLGKYHPHGDSSIYDAMTRMAQDFAMRYPMVDGQGNFGSIDGDGAAAMRYTEARMSRLAGLMVDSIRKDTVDFRDNYDGSDTEPVVLPARIPNLLITGATGIAVGMATNIPPHNLREIINGVIAVARNPEIELQELMRYVSGPDFPTGGIILGSAGIVEGYETSRGSITIRSKTRIEEMKNGKSRIIVEEIPYMVNKARMIEKIAQLVKDKTIEGITDLRDESSREGIRVVISIKKQAIPEVILNKLFKMSPLQTSFSMNMLALVDGEPKNLGLKECLEVYFKHQLEVVSRRTKFDLDKAEARASILEGLKIAIQNINEVISIVRRSSNDAEAQERLMEQFGIKPDQAKAITDMRLGRLTGLAIEKMNQELEALESEITKLRNILENRNVLQETIISELEEIREKYGDDRRTEIIEGLGSITDEDLIPQKDIAITMSTKGYVKRVPLEEYQIQKRGGVGSKSMNTYEDDGIEKLITTNTHTDLLIFSSFGKVYRIRAHQIPELSKQSKGIPFINIIPIEKTEKVVSMVSIDEYKDDDFLITATRAGVVKKTPIDEYSRINKNGKRALGLREDDSLFKALVAKDSDELLLGASNGKLVRFDVEEIRSMGRTATGVRGINLQGEENHRVVGFSSVHDGGYVLSIGENGFGKKTLVEEYRKTRRGAKGVKTIDITKAGALKFVGNVQGEEDILIITRAGITIRTSLKQVSTSGRGAKGVKVISLRDKNTIKSIAVVDTEEVQEQIDDAIAKTQEINIKNLGQPTSD